MSTNIWQQLKKPFFVLAPMEDVTNTAFRQVITKIGKPDLFFTEFASTDGLISKGRKAVSNRFKFHKTEKPIIAQIWGNDPDKFYQSAQYLAENYDFDGIDINMGCPVRDVVKKGSCSALIQNPTLAAEIIAATKDGANELPVSVKTRIGYSKVETEDWCGFLLGQDISALTVHGRTRKQNYGGMADWNEIGKVVEMRNQMNKSTIIIGNGDVKSYQEGLDKVRQYGVDGIMVGRAILSNPWIFNSQKDINNITLQERLETLIRHIELFEREFSYTKPFFVMRKYFKAYVNGFAGAKELRMKLIEVVDADAARRIIREACE